MSVRRYATLSQPGPDGPTPCSAQEAAPGFSAYFTIVESVLFVAVARVLSGVRRFGSGRWDDFRPILRIDDEADKAAATGHVLRECPRNDAAQAALFSFLSSVDRTPTRISCDDGQNRPIGWNAAY